VISPSLTAPPEPFSLERAYALALASELAYEDGETIARTACDEWGFDHCSFIDADDSQVFWATDRGVLVVAFRGTEAGQFADWLTDADFTLVDGPLGAQVHEGFYDALADVWQRLHHEVSLADPQRRKSFWITGHSLGGALAALAAARWIDGGRPVAGLYTFGQPRTGDAAFRRNFNFVLKASTFRFVNDNDLVTRVPPRAMGFSHLGTLRYFTDAGRLECDASWWQMFLDRWTFRLDGFFDGVLEAAEDHSMTGYRRLIEASLDRCDLRFDAGFDTSRADILPFLLPVQRPLILPRRRAG